jgi:hypothetical protein
MTYSVQNDIHVCVQLSPFRYKDTRISDCYTRLHSLSPDTQLSNFHRKTFIVELTVTQIKKSFLSFYEYLKLRYRTNKSPLLKLILKRTHLI